MESGTPPAPPERDDQQATNPFTLLTARSLFHWMLLSVLAYLVLLSLAGDESRGALAEMRATVWVYGSLLAWLGWRLERLKVREKDLIGGKPPAGFWWRGAVLVLLLLCFAGGFAAVSYYMLSLSAPEVALRMLNDTSIFVPWRGAGSALHYAELLAASLVLRPVAEELIFRVVLLHRWALKWGTRRGVLGSSLAYSLVGSQEPVSGFLFGAVMATLYVRTRSLAVPVACHVLYSALVLALEGFVATGGKVTLQDLRSYVGWGLAAVVASAPGLILYLRRSWPTDEWQPPYFAAAPPPAQAAEL